MNLRILITLQINLQNNANLGINKRIMIMKYFVSTTLLFGMLTNIAFSKESITCRQSSEGDYSLKVEVDKLETYPPKSIVQVFSNGKLLVEELAIAQRKTVETFPPMNILDFEFIEDEEFEFLRINKSTQIALFKPGWVYSNGRSVVLNFAKCNIK